MQESLPNLLPSRRGPRGQTLCGRWSTAITRWVGSQASRVLIPLAASRIESRIPRNRVRHRFQTPSVPSCRPARAASCKGSASSARRCAGGAWRPRAACCCWPRANAPPRPCPTTPMSGNGNGRPRSSARWPRARMRCGHGGCWRPNCAPTAPGSTRRPTSPRWPRHNDRWCWCCGWMAASTTCATPTSPIAPSPRWRPGARPASRRPAWKSITTAPPPSCRPIAHCWRR